MPTPLPTWDGVEYVDSAALPTVRTVQMYGSPVDNVIPGASIVCQATITGVPGSGPFEYKFEERKLGDPWSLAQNWSANDNLVWSTEGYTSGAYNMRVSVRKVDGTSLLGMATMPFTVASLTTLSTDLASPQNVGASVVFTGAATGGAGPFEYRFEGRAVGSPAWALAQDYSSLDNWTWNTATVPAGSYEFRVLARTVGSATEATSAVVPYTLTAAVATGVTLQTSVPSPQDVGASIVFTGAATGGPGRSSTASREGPSGRPPGHWPRTTAPSTTGRGTPPRCPRAATSSGSWRAPWARRRRRPAHPSGSS